MSSANTNNITFNNNTTVNHSSSVYVTKISTNGDAGMPSSPVVPPHLRTKEQRAACRATLATAYDKPMSKVQQRLQENYAKQKASPFRPMFSKSAGPPDKQPTRGEYCCSSFKKSTRATHGDDGAGRGGTGVKNSGRGNVVVQATSITANGGSSNSNVQVNLPVSNKQSMQKRTHSGDAPANQSFTVNRTSKEVNTGKSGGLRGKLSEADKDKRRKEGRCFICGSEMHKQSKCPELNTEQQNNASTKPSTTRHAPTQSAITKPTTTKPATKKTCHLEAIRSAHDHAVKYGGEGKYAQETAVWDSFADQSEARALYAKTARGYAERKQELAQMEQANKQNGGNITNYNFNETFTKRGEEDGEDKGRDW